jgi:D-arabinose 1-dehydrogenase-like Zn-dependent alcohol dehydrogenase
MKDSLSKVHFVIHGIDADGSGDLSDEEGRQSSLNEDLPIDATAPALCGTLTATSAGAVDTGAGGTATDSNSALVLGLGGLALAGALAFRRFGFTS